jgi:hypothetical protein
MTQRPDTIEVTLAEHMDREPVLTVNDLVAPRCERCDRAMLSNAEMNRRIDLAVDPLAQCGKIVGSKSPRCAANTRGGHREVTPMQPKRTIPRVCEYCGSSFLATPGAVNSGGGRYCSRLCFMDGRLKRRPVTFDRNQWVAEARGRAQAFVAEINARTYCAHCGAQPIEWHNSDHVNLNRRRWRIGAMAIRGATNAAIQAEMDCCTPLCRRCHMAEDGRLKALVDSRPYKAGDVAAPKPCTQCARLYRPLRRGLCSRCYDRRKTMEA